MKKTPKEKQPKVPFSVKLENALSFLNAPTPALIGMDISSTFVKMVELSKKKGRYTLVSYAIEPFGRDVMSEGGVANMDELVDAIAKCHKKLGSKIKNVAIGLPSSLVVSKRIKVPNTVDIEDETMVLDEATQAIPFSLNEVNIDWAYLGPTQGSEDFSDLMLTVARKVKIEDRVAALEQAGLKAIVVDVESIALKNAVRLSFDESLASHEAVAVAEAGYNSMRFSVYQNGEETFSKDIPTGSQILTESISAVYGISMDEAEYAKRNGGQNLEGYAENALHPFIDGLGMELSRAMQFFLTQATVEKLDIVLLCGGCALLDDAAARIESIIGVPTLIANPFVSMDVSSKMKNMAFHDAPLLLTATGLALRKFD